MKQRLLTILYVAVFIVSGYMLVQYFYTYYETSQSLKEIQTVYRPVTTLKDRSPSKLRESFEPLQAINKDIVGWITVDGTKLDNPILQATNNETYLDHNYKGDFSRAGSVFMDYRNDVKNAGFNTVIYGHAMRNGTMFGNLHQYTNNDYAAAHPTMYFDTMYEGYKVEVFAAYETHISFDYIKTDFADEIDYANFLQSIKEKSVIAPNVEVSTNDNIITLSTCTSQTFYGDNRFVVHGKLVKR